MTDLLTSDKKKIELLKVLSDGKVYTYYRLSKIIKTNYETVKKNCKFLELLNFVEIMKVDKEESASGVASYRVKITERGLKFLENLKM
uniref:Transcriptional regulator n=1 Tax=Fervidobacterium pennivorans TaxID=93466 RepID=A0A7V4KBQ0_FERPE